jgi:hypothetical protein
VSHVCDGRDLSCASCTAIARRLDTVRSAMTLDDDLDDIKRARIWNQLEDRISDAAAARRSRRGIAIGGAAAAAVAAIAVVSLWPHRDELHTLTVPVDTIVASRLGPYTSASIVGPAELELLAGAGGTTAVHLYRGTLLAEFEGGAGRALRIETGAALIEVVGTLFAVEARGSTTCTSVVRGRVRVTTAADVVYVTAGQRHCTGDSLQPISDDMRTALVQHGARSEPAISAREGSPAAARTAELDPGASGAAPASSAGPAAARAAATAPAPRSGDPDGPGPAIGRPPAGSPPTAAPSAAPSSAPSAAPSAAPSSAPSAGAAPSPASTPRIAGAAAPPPLRAADPGAAASPSPRAAAAPRAAAEIADPGPAASPSLRVADPGIARSSPVAEPDSGPAPRSAVAAPSADPGPRSGLAPSSTPAVTAPRAIDPVAAPASTPDALYRVAEAALAAHDPAAADRALATLVTEHPASSLVDEALYERARIAYQRRAWSAARTHLAQLAATRSALFAEPGHYLRCRIGVETGEPTAAACLVDYRAAFPRSPHDLDALALLVQLAHARAGCPGAAALVSELTQTYPRTTLAAAWRARCPEQR